jgi:hypothetical protein
VSSSGLIFVTPLTMTKKQIPVWQELNADDAKTGNKTTTNL